MRPTMMARSKATRRFAPLVVLSVVLAVVIPAAAFAVSGCHAPGTVAQGTPPGQGSPPGQGTSSGQGTGSSGEQPVAPEQNPPGDIPDSQVFVKYTSTSSGYELQVPEGWARTENDTGVSFVDKLDGVSVTLAQADTAPTVDSVKAGQVAELRRTGRAVTVEDVKAVDLPAGKAILVVYGSNSDPDPVTGKQVRLENNLYIFWNQDKRLASLTLWAPYGADNVDQWKFMSESFGWH